MTEEVGEHIRVAVLMVFTAAFVATVVNVTIMSISILNGYNNKYTNGLVTANEGSVADLSKLEEVAAPIIYSSLVQSINSFDQVEIGRYDNGNWVTDEIIYKYNDTSAQRLEALLSKYDTAFAKVIYKEPGTIAPYLKTIRIVITKDMGG